MGGLETAPEAGLGQGLRDGDEAALATLYDRYMPGIYDFLGRFLHDVSAAEDLTQMTFVRAWESRSKLRDPARVRAWLYTIAHNLAVNHVTRMRKSEPIEDQFALMAPGPGPEDQAATKEVAELVWAAAASLEPRQYAVLDLSVRRELSSGEIAQMMGIPAGHAAVLVNRAREALGNAVRYLLVARRRDHCPRLSELVPAGVQALTPEQRGTVDRHMRRCPECQGLANRLSSPAELFGGLIALPVPAALRDRRRDAVLVAARRAEQSARGASFWRPQVGPRTVALAVVALLLFGSSAWELYVHRLAPSLSSAGQTAGLKPSGPLATGTPALPVASSQPSPGEAVTGSATGGSRGTGGEGSQGSAGGAAGGDLAGGAEGGSRPGSLAARRTPPNPPGGATGQPSSPPVPTPPPTTAPTPRPFAVQRVNLITADSVNFGCPINQVYQWVCHFTVFVNTTNAPAGSVVTGTLTGTSLTSGGSTETQVQDFTATVPAGNGTTRLDLALHFKYPPCSSVNGLPPGSTASASSHQPNTVTSGPVSFGARCGLVG